MDIGDFTAEVDVQIIIPKFCKKLIVFVFTLDLSDCLLVNIDSIISLASMTHITWSNSCELHHMDEIVFSTFLKFESESELGIRYLICKQTLG